jgi:hypothetical protein
MARWPWFWAARGADDGARRPQWRSPHHSKGNSYARQSPCLWRPSACASSATVDATFIAGIGHSSVWGVEAAAAASLDG